MKRLALPFLADVALMLGLASAGHAVEILHWERLPLAVPLIVGEERVIFIDRNVRIGVPPSLREHLRVQSAGGAIYLRANAPIEPTRLQLQDANTGALILLDIAAKLADPNQARERPDKTVGLPCPGNTDSCCPDPLRGAEPLRAPAHCRGGERTFHCQSAAGPRAGHVVAVVACARDGVGGVETGR